MSLTFTIPDLCESFMEWAENDNVAVQILALEAMGATGVIIDVPSYEPALWFNPPVETR